MTFLLVACGADATPTPAPEPEPTVEAQPTDPPAPTPTEAEVEPTSEPTIEPPAALAVETMMRESGLMVTVQDLGDVVIHSLTAPEEVFANSTHIVETANSLVLY
ncbi:MAG: hypothetical protein AAF633_08755, partial [Chloroflexota bacterium]